MTERLFVSSTVFDLIDVRHEVESLVHEMGMTPVLSGSSTADFHKPPDQNTIETCLANLRSCSAVLLILDQRYGPSLKSAGFEDKSATHLEYLEARKLSLPIYAYVRDRLEADYNIWRKNKSTQGLSLMWVSETHDRRLFEIIDEHKRLIAGESRANWYDTFRHSGELKSLIRRDFRFKAGQIELEKMIDANHIPMLELTLEADADSDRSGVGFLIRIYFANLGGSAAYKISWTWHDEGDKTMLGSIPELAPQQKTVQTLFLKHAAVAAGVSDIVEIVYFTARGHRIIDQYSAGVRIAPSRILMHGAQFISRRYEVSGSEERPFTIVNV